ncbi:hypothetical protein DPMN_107495 [Dreissena polymorpha]|uniref:Uncharacterized protein n=1 Tax=Dreissena polymorpha TaxID=45954 RepID=A0A9D4K7A4_DREPO|nr:hypothetical protein DPMN_102828 [Dreissena polymorpha]KAH3834176.1 hypothetical protein DPMN_107495 [Dreissena polymorpha]
MSSFTSVSRSAAFNRLRAFTLARSALFTRLSYRHRCTVSGYGLRVKIQLTRHSLCVRLRWKVFHILQPIASFIRSFKDMFTLVVQSTYSRMSGQNSTAHQGVPTQRTASVPTTTQRP